jgi:protein-S-isoprenylcysteine O-methyltransferase Ste14
MTARRGTGWVVAQFALIAAVFAAALVPPAWPESARGALSLVGIVLAVSGAAVAIWAARTLGRSLTPFPRPTATGSLVERGPYRAVRHPMYSGGILFFLGWSLFAGPVALALTACLIVLWALKARVEEAHLSERDATVFAAYAHRVRYRLVPGVF